MAGKMRFWGLFIALSLLITACGGQTPTATPPPTPPPPPTVTITPSATPDTRRPIAERVNPDTQATITFFLAAGDAPAVDIYIEASLTASRLAAGRPSARQTVNAGEYSIRVVPAGEGTTSERLLYSGTLSFRAKTSTILVFHGAADALQGTPYLEDLTGVPAKQARLSVVNALSETGAAEATFGELALGAADVGGLPTDAVLVPAGRGRFRFARRGTTLVEVALSPRERQTNTIIVYDGAGDKPTAALISTPTQLESQLRILHASRTAGVADIYLDDRKFLASAEFPRGTQYETTLAGNYTLRLTSANGADTLAALRVTLAPDAKTTVIITDIQNPRPKARGEDTYQEIIPSLTLLKEDLSPLPEGLMRLTVYNAIANTTDAQISDPVRLVPGLTGIDYGKASRAAELSAGERGLVVTGILGSGRRTLEFFDLYRFKPGFAYLYVITGQEEGLPVFFETEVGVKNVITTATPALVMNVRFVNALTNVGDVDVRIGGRTIFSAVPPETALDFTPIEGIVSTIQIIPTGGETVILTAELVARANTQLSIIALGSGENLRLLQTAERYDSTTSGALLRFVHAAPGVEAVTIQSPLTIRSAVNIDPSLPTPTPVVRSVQQYERVESLSISRIRAFRAGTYTFTANRVTDGSLVADVFDVTILEGKRYDLILFPGDTSRAPRLVLLETKAMDE
ncbi:MAG: DUF4397 domain-containing protein [Anaerolineales bacterium]|nr:DUF4397 domain-containing protein [Anaerolineales bacterium]